MSHFYRVLLVILFLLMILPPSNGFAFNQPQFVSKFGRGSYDTAGQLNFPSGISIDSDGNIYVCGSGGPQRISKFDNDGNYITRWNGNCMGLEADDNNDIYVAVSKSHKVSQYDQNGALIREWGTFGSANGQFNMPRDVAVNNSLGYVYVADSMNYRVQVFDTIGNFLFEWGSMGSGDGQFEGPRGPFGIAVDQASGAVYVTDSEVHMIKKFDQNGNFLLKWGGQGAAPGNIRWPRDLEVNSLGQVYESDGDNERIQVFDSSGNFLATFQGPHNEINGPFHPRSVAIDPRNDNVFVAASYSHRIDKFDSAGNFIKSFGWWEKGSGVLNSPSGIAIDKVQGYIYIADTNNFMVQKFDINGSFMGDWGYSDRVYGIYDGGDGAFDFISNITIDSAGNTYYFRRGVWYWGAPEYKRIQIFNPNGIFLSSWNYTDFDTSTRGITYSPFNGYFYVSNTGLNMIQCFDENGTFLFEFGGYGAADGKFNAPTRIAADSGNGDIYVLDANNDRIQKFSADGIFLTKWGQYGTGDGDFDFAVYNGGIYVDGYVYVADTNNKRVQVFDTNGNFILKFGEPGGADGKFGRPEGLVVDSSGFIYVLDGGKNNVQKFSSIGNPGPTADPNGPYYATTGEAVTLDGSGSYSSNGNIILYEWDIEDDGIYDYVSPHPTQVYTYFQEGNYNIRLRVTDNINATGESTTTAVICPGENLIVRIPRVSPVYFSSIQAAYDAAVDGEIIQAQSTSIMENLNIYASKAVTFEGGYNCSYTVVTGNTTLIGNMTFVNGTVMIRDFSVQ